MSHWTKATVQPKDLDVLAKVAQKHGVEVQRGELKFTSSYAGTLDAKMILRKNGGDAGIVVNAKGENELTMDNYNNPLAREFGNDCQTLMRDYTAEVVRKQALLMGGMVTQEKTLEDGSVEIHIGIN